MPRGGRLAAYSIEASFEKLMGVYRRTCSALNVSGCNLSRLASVQWASISIPSPLHRDFMPSFRIAGASALLLSLCASPAHSQAAPPASRPGATAVAASDTTATARIIREIAANQRAMTDLAWLTYNIGPRLTGSDKLVRAHAWAESTLVARGAANVHREAYAFGRSWTRGPRHGALPHPERRPDHPRGARLVQADARAGEGRRAAW